MTLYATALKTSLHEHAHNSKMPQTTGHVSGQNESYIIQSIYSFMKMVKRTPDCRNI